jgi:hypothetical protein
VQEQRRIQPATSQTFEPDEEFDYVELDEQRQREPQRQRRYLDEEESRYEQPRYEEARYDERPPEPIRRPLQAEPLPRQARPLEARPLERRPAPTPYREPLDVEAEDLASNDLDDPW